MLCSCLYYTMFYQLTQLLFCPSSITCVNSMDASYIPIAEARGFTTHWIRKRVSRAVARLCSLPLILFFVGYNVRGENACPSVPLLPHGFDCPFQNEKVKGCLRQFFSMLPIADPQAEAHGSIEKNKPLTISFFHFQSHPRGSKLHCISGEIHARIYPLDKWLATCYIMCSGYIASSLNG